MSSESNSYQLYTAQDALKTLEGEYNAMLKEELNLATAIEANRAKLDKYRKLKEIHEALKNHTIFSGKLRSILRNVISIFHQEKSIVLFLIKDGKFLKAEADKNDDMLVGEPDQESLYLKNFDEWIIKNRKSIIISDMQKEIRFKAGEDNKIRSLIAVPVFINDETAGVLRISSDKAGCFNQEDLRFLDLIAEMIGKVLKEETANAQ
jgi:transcriptional regulator with GAF, ATPase, and Fis domain